MSVGEICNREVIVTDPDTSTTEAARLMREHHVGDLVLVEASGRERVPVGIVTDRDLVVEVLGQGVDPGSVAVKDLVTRGVFTAREGDDFWDTLTRMRSLGVRRMPVVNEDGGLEGILTLDDALELLAEGMNGLVRLIGREVRRESETRR